MIFGDKDCRTAKGALVLNLKEAKIPGVVRVDLSSLPFTHFHVRSGNEGSVLGYNDAENRFTAIALFADRSAADRALHKVEAELLRSACGVREWILRIGGVLLAAFLVLLILSLAAEFLSGSKVQGSHGTPAVVEGLAPPVGGVPMDADSKFGVQQ
jgi:hypothetical protein